MKNSNYLFLITLLAGAGLGSGPSEPGEGQPPGLPSPHKFNVGDDITAKPFLPPELGGHIYRIERVNTDTYTVRQVYPTKWEVTQNWSISYVDANYVLSYYMMPTMTVPA